MILLFTAFQPGRKPDIDDIAIHPDAISCIITDTVQGVPIAVLTTYSGLTLRVWDSKRRAMPRWAEAKGDLIGEQDES